MLDLLDELGVERAHVAGLSLGGMIGMWLAINAPERVDRLVAAVHVGEARAAGDVEERAETVREAGTRRGRRRGRGALAHRRLRAQPDLVASLRAMIVAHAAEGYARCCAAIERMDLAPTCERITAPTLVIAAREDPATPPGHAEVIAAAIAGARLEMLDAGAHLGNVEQATPSPGSSSSTWTEPR